MKSSFEVSKDFIEKNIETLQNFMAEKEIEAFYISSFDTFLSEYVPLEECHRYYFTGFTGSVADILIPAKGRVQLFVDGRYHEQADLEVDAKYIEVMKCPYGKSLWKALQEEVALRQYKVLAIEGDRVPYSSKLDLLEYGKVISFDNKEIADLIGFDKFTKELDLEEVSIELTGESTEQKLQKILNNEEALFVTSLDSISWLSNLRGFQLPFQASFMAKAFATRDELYLFIDQEIEFEAPKGISIHYAQDFNLNKTLRAVVGENTFKKIFLQKSLVNVSDYNVLENTFGENSLIDLAHGLVPYHALKNDIELETIKKSFKKADQAIYKSINWLKNKVATKDKTSELDFYNATNEIYKKSGARDQSFNTIAAVGANSSVIHFSGPSHEVLAEDGQMVLLDSGAFYEGGYATDTTRTFFLGNNPTQKHKEIYTLVLKGLLHCQNAVFPVGTWGSAIDSLARFSMRNNGYDYAHGTGHGVGINVHEGNFRLSPTSQTPIYENHVGSIEPGIYLPGFGGVRLENIVIVKKHPDYKDMLRFESLVYIGFEEILIDRGLLTEQEIIWLDEYEAICKERGTSFES